MNERAGHYYEWINTLRVFTLLLVIIGHCNYYIIKTPHGGIDYFPHGTSCCFIYNILKWGVWFIYLFHMPLFMAISGMCFSFSKQKNSSIIKLSKSKAKRLLLPFLTVTTFLSIPLKYISGYWGGSDNLLKDIVIGQYFLINANSHLWFIVSLFNIFLIFHLINRRFKINTLFMWICLFILNLYISPYISSKIGAGFGLSCAATYLLFFTFGYASFKWLNKINTKLSYGIISWILMASFFFIYRRYGYVQSHLLNKFIFIAFSFWGIFNMIITCKFLSKTKITKTKTYKIISKYNYELYLYSDPFNYVIIALLFNLLGNNIFYNNICCITAFGIRFALTISIPFLIIFLQKFFKNQLKDLCK